MAVREPPVEQGGRRSRAMPTSRRDVSGWIVFASVVLIVAGFMRVFDAIWAFRYNGTLPDNLQDAIFGRSLTTYGWIYVIAAIVLIGAGLLVLRGSQGARWIGVVAGGLGALAAMPWMPYYPVWSLVYIAIGVLVVYALVAHGGRDEMP
jgi:hypothetical protein